MTLASSCSNEPSSISASAITSSTWNATMDPTYLVARTSCPTFYHTQTGESITQNLTKWMGHYTCTFASTVLWDLWTYCIRFNLHSPSTTHCAAISCISGYLRIQYCTTIWYAVTYNIRHQLRVSDFVVDPILHNTMRRMYMCAWQQTQQQNNLW